MKLPYPNIDNIPIKIILINGIDRNGVPKVIEEIETKCTLNEKNLYIRNADGKLIRLESRVYIGRDIAPEQMIIEGKVELGGKTYNIYRTARPRNPDGSVHHTKLELI